MQSCNCASLKGPPPEDATEDDLSVPLTNPEDLEVDSSTTNGAASQPNSSSTPPAPLTTTGATAGGAHALTGANSVPRGKARSLQPHGGRTIVNLLDARTTMTKETYAKLHPKLFELANKIYIEDNETPSSNDIVEFLVSAGRVASTLTHWTSH